MGHADDVVSGNDSPNAQDFIYLFLVRFRARYDRMFSGTLHKKVSASLVNE